MGREDRRGSQKLAWDCTDSLWLCSSFPPETKRIFGHAVTSSSSWVKLFTPVGTVLGVCIVHAVLCSLKETASSDCNSGSISYATFPCGERGSQVALKTSVWLQYMILFLFLRVVLWSKDLSHTLGLCSAVCKSDPPSYSHISAALYGWPSALPSCRSERRHPVSQLQNTQTFSFSCNSECSLAICLCRPVFVCMCQGYGYVCQGGQEKARPTLSGCSAVPCHSRGSRI